VKRNARRPKLTVTTGGQGVVAHAGARLLCELADDVGLTDALSEAMARSKQRRRGHDRGQVLVDMAVAIADGATTLSDVRVLGDQPGLFGDVASVPTMWRTLEATDRSTLERIGAARARAREAAWMGTSFGRRPTVFTRSGCRTQLRRRTGGWPGPRERTRPPRRRDRGVRSTPGQLAVRSRGSIPPRTRSGGTAPSPSSTHSRCW
jgi:Transposase DDE domain group 1